MRTARWLLPLLLLAALPARTMQVNPEAERRLALLRASLDDGKIDEAIAHGEAAVELAPQRSSAHHWLGRALAAKAIAVKNFTEIYWLSRAETELRKAIELHPKNLDARLDLIQFDLARRRPLDYKVPPRAREQANAILAENAVLGHLAWAVIYAQSKEPEKAEERYKNALEADPKSLRALTEFTGFYADRLRFKEAIELTRQFAAANPENPIPLYLLGKLTLMSGKDLEGGLSYFDKFLAQEAPPEGPSHADAWWRKGMILEQLGKKDQAASAFKKAVALDPDHKEALAKVGKK